MIEAQTDGEGEDEEMPESAEALETTDETVAETE